MNIFAIADLHLGLGIDKTMDIFGPQWQDHTKRLKDAWDEVANKTDLVLIPGDISWAINLEEAKPDIEFLGDLPGKKLIIKGNHDYWWASLKKLKEFLPPNIIPMQNTAFVYENIGIAGTRLWIDPDLNLENASNEDKKIFDRELHRLESSLNALPGGLHKRIIMTHFPPISLDGKPGRAVDVASKYGCDIWAFGHMHLGDTDYSGFNTMIGNTRYEFVSADYLDFRPKLILGRE
ncbi:MAG: metallophosphoesterase [Deltaproteobacteria bacterium]|nr:metallophosphoesterase [Deltaproteobacteria bacterium]